MILSLYKKKLIILLSGVYIINIVGLLLMSHTVSFCILDDLKPAYGPFHESMVDLTKSNIEQAVRKLLQDFLTAGRDPSGYYCKEINELEIKSVTNSLCNRNYYVINRFEKYYVIAFAIDYTRFEVFSRDCDKELIKWRTDDTNDPVTGLITDDEYNVSPVFKLMKALNDNV